MVRLFSVSRGGVRTYVLARLVKGIYTIESINGHDAAKFPAFVTKRALTRVAARQTFSRVLAASVNNETRYMELPATRRVVDLHLPHDSTQPQHTSQVADDPLTLAMQDWDVKVNGRNTLMDKLGSIEDILG